MKLDERLTKLEAERPSEYVFNCLTNADLIRFEELISKKDHTEEEFRELIELDEKAKRDARTEFMNEYDTSKPLNVRSVFNAFNEYQKEHGRNGILVFPDFSDYLKNNGYEITE